jgi:hypothetical protein
MNTLIESVILAAIVLALIALASWRRWGFKRFPLIVWIFGVAVVWAVILGVMWFSGDMARFQTYSMVCYGFAIGMLAMYIAMHVYKS